MVRSNVHRFVAIRAFVLGELFAIGPLASAAAPAFAQATFEKVIATPQSSYAQDVQQTSDGGYVVAANYCPGTCYVALVSKLDSGANLPWTQRRTLLRSLARLEAELTGSLRNCNRELRLKREIKHEDCCPLLTKLDGMNGSNGNKHVSSRRKSGKQ